MDSHQHHHDLRTRQTNMVPEATPPVAFDGNQIKNLADLQPDSEDDSSRTPSMTDGSSRTSSVYSASDHRKNSAKSHASRSVSDTDSVWYPQEDENSNQRRRTQSPIPLRKCLASRAVRDSTPLSLNSSNCYNVRGCGGLGSLENHSATAAIYAGAPLENIEEHSNPRATLPIRNTFPGTHPVATKMPDIQDVKTHSELHGSDSDSAESNSESDEDSTDETDSDDDNWSGATDYFETAVLQAVYPDRELAAHLIIQLYGMFYPGSSKTISRKVSHWREAIRTCATDSGTVSTEKGPASSSNATSSTSKPNNQKRDRLSSSTDSNTGEEDDEDDDDTDENRRKRLKETSQDGGIVLRLACPFFKMNPEKYCAQLNQGQDGKYYRICAGPGFKSIQSLKEHLKRKHYPVQCYRCYLIFNFKGKTRSSAVSVLEKHLQSDEGCQRNQESMKEGISDAQWSKLDEKKPGKKGKGAAEEKPKSDVDKWNDIWTILFPEIPVPPTPWYDNFSMEVPAHPSQGLRNFLEVHAKTVEFKLPNIKAARSDDELKSLLLDLAQKVFQVWTTTANEASTSSLSNSGGSDPLSSGSWERVPSHTPTDRFPSPRLATSVFPNLGQSSRQNSATARSAIQIDHPRNATHMQVPQQDTPFSVGNVSPNPQGAVPTGEFAMGYQLGTELQTFQQNRFSENMPENSTWINPMQQLPFNNHNGSFEDVSMGGGIQADSYDMGRMPQHLVQNMQPPQWDPRYSSPEFGNYGGGP